MTPEHFLLIADALPEPMVLLSGDGHILAGNPATRELLGIGPEVLWERTLAEIATDPPDRLAHYLRLCSRSRNPVLGAMTLRGRGGDIACRTFGNVVSPKTEGADTLLLLRLLPKQAATGQFVALNRQIEQLKSEVQRRRRAEEQAREQEERLRVTLMSIGDAVITADTAGRVTNLNAVAESLTGWTTADATGQRLEAVFRIVNESTRQPVENPAMRALQEGVIVGLANHTVLIARDGTERHIDDSAAPIRDAGGRVVGVVLVFHDITGRRRTEAERDRFAAESERQRRLYETVLSNTPDFAYVFSLDHQVIYANDALIRMWGRGRDGAIGKTFLEIGYEPWHADMHDREIDRVRATKQPIRGEVPFTGADGRREYDYIFVPVLGADGEVEAVAGTTRDVTERKGMERQLREKGERLRTALTAARMVAWEWTPADGSLRVSENAADVFGLPAGVGLTRIEQGLALLHPDDVAAYRATFQRAIHERGSYLTRYRLIRPDDGGTIWIEERGNVAPDRSGGGVRLFGVAMDVTNRERLDAELRASEYRYRTLLERIPEPLFVYDRETLGYLAVNDAAVVSYGYTRDEFLGMTIKDIRPAGDVPALLDMLARSPGGFEDRGRWRHRKKDGTVFDVEIIAHDLDLAGRPACVILARDVTARLLAEQALHLRDRAIRAVVGGILITDANAPDNPIIYVSPGFGHLTGYTEAEAVGRNCRFLQGKDTDPHAVAAIRAAVGAGLDCSVELLNYRKDGTAFWNALSISPVRNDAGDLTHFVGVQTDVTGRRSLEEQFRQAQKMEAVGQLAGGVAHDFNNLLTVINGYGEIVHESLPPDHPSRGPVAEVIKAGERAAGLTRQLLAFSRRTVLEPKVLDPNALVRDLERMLRRLIGEDIDLATRLSPDVGRVRADPGQLEQAVVNLCVNARDAMPTGGKLTVETRDAELNAAYAAAHPDVQPGPYVLVAVSDSGSGMTPEVQARIFEPFFTTKGLGKGTGLGLAMVFGFVKQSGGHVAVYSEPGRGTTVKLYLPRVADAPQTGQSAVRRLTMPRGTETVLLVEDEDAVRALGRHVLGMCGYTVLEAGNGEEAVRVADGHAGPLHLLVTDVVMPGGMGGRQVAEAVLARRSGVKVLFTSGYTDDAVVRHGVLEEGTHFLQKPFTPAAFAGKVRDLLDGKG